MVEIDYHATTYMKNLRGVLNNLANDVVEETLSSTDRRELQNSIEIYIDEAMENIQDMLENLTKK